MMKATILVLIALLIMLTAGWAGEAPPAEITLTTATVEQLIEQRGRVLERKERVLIEAQNATNSLDGVIKLINDELAKRGGGAPPTKGAK